MTVALKTAVIEEEVAIKPPNIRAAEFILEGTTPYMQHRFWKKAELIRGHQQGKQGGKRPKKEPRDFRQEWQEATYKMADGSYGINVSAFRQGLISACRLANFKMTVAKLSIFVLHDGFDERDGTLLVRLDGDPRPFTTENIQWVKNDDGSVDLRARPIWDISSVKLRIRYDADQFALMDVTNLLQRLGEQVGLGEGRPDSKYSAGLGYGLFAMK